MKRFLFAIIALMAVVNVKGASATGALTNMVDTTITYQSVDAQNREITLSAKLYYKSNKDVSFVMINCHPTITHNDGCPTGGSPQMEAVKYMISENALVVCPDYIGFGKTKNVTHPYMCATLTGRNVLDAYKAAIKYVKEQSKPKLFSWSKTEYIKILDNYYTINVGYSQGGATALAFQRYLETEATEADRKLVNLRGSVCGAGPYDQNIVFDTYELWCNNDETYNLDYPVYLPYVLRGHKEAFGETTMRKLELKDCFTEKFWSYYESTLKSALDAKVKTVDELNADLKAAGFNRFYDIINADYAIRTSKVYRTIRKTLEQSNLLAGTADDWTPKTPIIFYHDKAGNDIVVPYACTEAALTRFAGHCSYVDAIDDYEYEVTFDRVGLATTDKENYLWHAAVFGEYWKDENKYPLQRTVKGLAVLSGNGNFKFSDLDHRAFGARFYAQILGVRRILRPDYDENGKYPGDNNGTADEINISPAVPTTYSIPATVASTADTYDRIEMALPTNMPEGKLTFLQFPATVDGYYFGADAKRYEVTLNDGEVESYEEMDDLADFEAGKVYLVEAPDNDNVINIVTAAKSKATIACDLNWRELNMRKTTTVTDAKNAEDGTSFVSNYMPFAYKPVGDAKAYVMKGNSEKPDYLTPSTLDVVPAGTGTIIACDPAKDSEGNLVQNPVIVLEPVMDYEAPKNLSSIKGILTGSYTTIENERLDYLHFGISTENRVGFWSYNMGNVRAYSAFIDMTERQSKGFIIDFQNDETGVNAVNDDDNDDDNLYNIVGQRVNENAKGIIIKNGKKYLVK